MLKFYLNKEMKSDDLLIKLVNQTYSGKKFWKIITKNLSTNEDAILVTNYVSIATGHHETPLNVTFPGQETFPGKKNIFDF